MATHQLFPPATDKAKQTVNHPVTYNKENEHTNAFSITTSTTNNFPKQNISDVLLGISNSTEANAELPFLTDEDITTFLDNCKNVQCSNVDNIVAMLQEKTLSDETSNQPYDNVSNILRSTNDILYSSLSNEIAVSNTEPTNCNGRTN